jgi:hypothetical protein
MTPDSPLGSIAKNFLNIPIIKQGIQKKMAENPGNTTFKKVINDVSKNMTSLLCRPGEVATIFNPTAPPYFPASNKTVSSTNPLLNSSLATNNTTIVQPQINKNDSISFKATLETRPYVSTQLSIPQKSTFGSGSPLCPTNDRKQEFIDAFYDTGQLSPSVQGTLKIENKTTSTPDIIKYSLISFASNFHVTGIEENRKTGHNVIVFGGNFNLGDGTSTMDAAMDPEFKYNVNGTFDNTTKVLTFKGQRSTS